MREEGVRGERGAKTGREGGQWASLRSARSNRWTCNEHLRERDGKSQRKTKRVGVKLKNIAILKQGSAQKCGGVSPAPAQKHTVNSFSLLLLLCGVRTVLLMQRFNYCFNICIKAVVYTHQRIVTQFNHSAGDLMQLIIQQVALDQNTDNHSLRTVNTHTHTCARTHKQPCRILIHTPLPPEATGC